MLINLRLEGVVILSRLVRDMRMSEVDEMMVEEYVEVTKLLVRHFRKRGADFIKIKRMLEAVKDHAIHDTFMEER